MRTDVDACDGILGLYKHNNRICTESWLWEENPLPHQGIKAASALHLAFLSDTLPTELSCPNFVLCVCLGLRLKACCMWWSDLPRLAISVQSLRSWWETQLDWWMNRHHVIRPSPSLSQRSRSVECSIYVRVKCLDEREIKLLKEKSKVRGDFWHDFR